MNPIATLFAEPLSPLDASFLYLERPTEHLHVAAVAVLAGAPPMAALVATLADRLGRLRRYRQVPERPRFDWHLPVWCDAPDFDVTRHVHRHALAAPGDEAAFRSAVDGLFARALPADRPLWECHLIEGRADRRAAVMIKVHHCMMGDGSHGRLAQQDLFLAPCNSTFSSSLRPRSLRLRTVRSRTEAER